MSDSVRPYGRQPTMPRHPWDSPGKNTGVGCHFLLLHCIKYNCCYLTVPTYWFPFMLADIIPKKNKGKKLSLGMIFVINTFTRMNRASNDT